MNLKKYHINIPAAILIIAVLGGLLCVGLYRTEIDYDIAGTLPLSDPVLSDARYILMNHPVQDRLVIDLTHQKDNPDILAEAGKLIQQKMESSGLFEEVGMKAAMNLAPAFITHITNHLPLMFTKKSLDDKISPLLKPAQLREKLENNFSRLTGIEGIGQAEFIAKDPLGMREIVMAGLSQLAPSRNARIYKGELLSSDRKHLLIVAVSKASGTDTLFSRNAEKLMGTLSEELHNRYAGQGYAFTLTPMGAYRAALDNERMAKRDTRNAILFSVAGIAFLLILAFPRPFVGLLSFVPAISGTVIAFFIFSIIYESVSILAIGFGGVIISITIDHGIAYLLFLDRPRETSGKEAAREVRAVGLLATLTTAGAFLTLSLSGFPILARIGQFAALGITFSFLSVHTLFPLIFPVMPPAKRKSVLPLQSFVNRLALPRGKYKVYAASALALFLLCFAKPVFHADLRSMNTVSQDTLAAENLIRQVWGDIFSKIFLMTEGKNIEELREKGDRICALLEEELISGTLSSAFIFSMIFPGNIRAEENFAAWKTFWDTERSEMKSLMKTFSADLGFAPDAFEPFYQLTDIRDLGEDVQIPPLKGGIISVPQLPEKFFGLLGISEKRDQSAWVQFSTLSPGPSYDAEKFRAAFASAEAVKVFDPGSFSARLGSLLFSTFMKMVLIIGISIAVILSVFFRNWKLTLAALTPVSFAFICTLGTLRLMGRPLDIPALMLSIVVLGMGIDYALFFVLSYRRYREESNPFLGLIRLAVFLASVSTVIGFAALCFAEHSLLRSAGISSLLGICYSLAGTFIFLPPALRFLYDSDQQSAADLKNS